MPPRIATVRQMASILAAQHVGSATPLLVGPNWVLRFINRYNDLKSKYNRKYDYQRAKCEDPTQIFFFFFFYIHCIILRTILRMQPLGYGAIVLYT